MQKPIKINIDTITKQVVTNYNNIIKGDTLLMTMNIYQNSASLNLADQSIHIILRKSDGYSVEKIINSVVGNTFQVDFDIQATLSVGEVQGEIQLIDNVGACISNRFIFEVGATLSDDIVIKSGDQIETLSQIVNLIDSYNENADNLYIQNNLAVQHEIDLTTINNTSSGLKTSLESDVITGQALDIILKDDISKGNALDIVLKADINIGATTDNTLKTSIINGNEVITNLATVNWATIQSYIALMNIMLSGMTVTNESNVDITDENNIEITM